MKREFEFSDDSSNKFWNIETSGTAYTVHFGRIGTDGQTRSKEFDSEEKAEAEANKQINSKVKKGYVETGGGNSAGETKAATTESKPKEVPKKKSPSKKAASKKAEPKATPEFSSAIESRIDLTPQEQMFRTWEEHEPLEKPESEPFDLDDCIERLKATGKGSDYWPNWKYAKVPVFPSREEAQFWLEAESIIAKSREIKDAVRKMGQFKAEGKMKLKKALKYTTHFSGEGADFFGCVSAIFTPEELIFNEDKSDTYRYSDLAAGIRNHVLPYLTKSEKGELRKKIKGTVKPFVSQNYYDDRPLNHFVASYLGMVDEIRPILKAYKDGQFGGQNYGYYSEQGVQWLVFGLKSPEEIEAEFRRLGLTIWGDDMTAAMLATTGLNMLDLFIESIKRHDAKGDAERFARGLKRVHSPEAAVHALALVTDSKAQKIGNEWLHAHPVESAVGLAAAARGKGKIAEAAKDHLLTMSLSEKRGALEAAKPNLDSETAEWLQNEIIENEDAQLTEVELKDLPEDISDAFESSQTRGKLVDWLVPAALPPIKIDGKKLAADQVKNLLLDFKSTGIGGKSELASLLKKHAEPNSLDAFSWKVFENWLNIGAPPKDKWAMGTLGHLGGDDCVLKLTPLLREWPGQSQHQRAVLGLDCLRQVGSETALMALNGIAQKLKYKGLKDKAKLRMQEIATEKGMTAEQLADRIVPDCGLDEKGSRTFDFGPRKFEFVFGSELKPAVRDESGKVRANLPPKPNKSDDADKAEIALADWRLLKKTLREVLKIQNARMEEAMITGRRWGIDDFKKLLMDHPLMIHLVRMFVWGVYDEKSGKIQQTFRVTEDNAFANSEDDDIDFPKSGVLGIVHPAHLSDTEKSNWGEVLSDYEIIPPIQQLGRSLYTFEPNEAKKDEITRFKGPRIPGISVYGILERSHWVRDTPADAGGFMQHSKYFPSVDVTAFVQYDPGLSIGWYDEEQTISSVYFVPGHIKPDWWGDHKNRIKIGEVDPVVLSEVLRIVHVLASKAI